MFDKLTPRPPPSAPRTVFFGERLLQERRDGQNYEPLHRVHVHRRHHLHHLLRGRQHRGDPARRGRGLRLPHGLQRAVRAVHGRPRGRAMAERQRGDWSIINSTPLGVARFVAGTVGLVVAAAGGGRPSDAGRSHRAATAVPQLRLLFSCVDASVAVYVGARCLVRRFVCSTFYSC